MPVSSDLSDVTPHSAMLHDPSSESIATLTGRGISPNRSPRVHRALRGVHSKKKGGGQRTSIKFTAKHFIHARKFGEVLEEYYDIGEKIGEGGFGEVFCAVHQKTGAERAVKVIYKTEDTDIDFEKVNTTIRNEFATVKSLDHPNLLKQYEMFEDEDKFMIVTDLYRGGELLDELEAIGCFQEDDAALLLLHMLTCINYLHEQNYAHRDLKPENILLEENMKLDDIKIIDFGLARQAVPGVKFKEFVGTSYYMCPQIVNEEPYTNKCDIWSCGVICFLVLGGYAPFDGDGLEEICERIEEGNVIFDDEPEVWDSVTDTAKEFIRYLLTYEEDERPTAFEALQHPWMEKIRSKTHRIFRRQSSKTAEQALGNMKDFDAGSKLKQATFALITSQLLLKEEKEQIDAVFRVMDRDCSGRLGKDEVKLAYKEFYKKDLSDEDVDIIFKRVNYSGSGAIEYSEFVVASLYSKNLLDDKLLKAAFDSFDVDGNGQIDIEELKLVLAVDDDMDDYVLENIIKQVDKDGDNEISYYEFKNMMLLTAAQPSKETQQGWQKRRESSTLSDGSHKSMDSSLSSNWTSMASLSEIPQARGVLSIFDVSSEMSMRLNDLNDMDNSRAHNTMDGSEMGRSLSNMTSTMYSRRTPSYRSIRSLPVATDTRTDFLKVNYRSFAKSTQGSLPRHEGGLGDDDEEEEGI